MNVSTENKDSINHPSQVNEDKESTAIQSENEKSADMVAVKSFAGQLPLSISKVDAHKRSDVFVDSVGLESPKNSKKRFTPFQVETLKQVFESTPYITQSQAATIARQTGLKKLQVRKWFSDYRCKIKRLSAGLDQLRLFINEADVKDEKLLSKNRVPKKRILTRSETDQQQQSLPPSHSRSVTLLEKNTLLEDSFEQSARTSKSPTYVKRTRRKMKKRDLENGSTTKRYKKNTAIIDYAESKHVKRFTPFQVETLKKTYTEHPYITQREAAVVARTIGLKKMQVRKWFCDYRCKMKKQTQRLQNSVCQAMNPNDSSEEVGYVPKKHLLVRFAKDPMSGACEHEEESLDEVEDSVLASADEVHTNGLMIEEKRRGRPRLQKRTFRFTENQLKILNEEFDKSQFLTDEKLNALCAKLKERRERIQTWFKMRRYKLRQSEQRFWQNIIG